MSMYTTGTVDIRVGSNTVTGNNTAFTTYVSSADLFKLLNKDNIYEIASVNSASTLVLTSRFRDAGYETERTNEHLATTAGATLSYTATMSYTPVIQNTLSINGSDETWTDSYGNGSLSCTSSPTGSSGTIDYDTGALSLTYSAQPTTGYNITASYTSGNNITNMSYQIITDFTTTYNFPKLYMSDTNYKAVYTKSMRMIDTALSNISGFSVESSTLLWKGVATTLTASGTFSPTDGNLFFVNATDADRDFSPSGSFAANTEIKIINTNSDFNLSFTSTELTATLAPGSIGRFYYNGTRWYTDSVYTPVESFLAMLNGSTLVWNSYDSTITTTTTFSPTAGNLFWIRPSGADRNFNPSGTFEKYTEIKVINLSATYNIVFDSTGIANTIAPTEMGDYIYDGTKWH